MSCDIRKNWKEWKIYLSILGRITVNRCFKPWNFKSVKEVTLHNFSDASEEGMVRFHISDWWILKIKSVVHLWWESHVAQLKFVSIPCLELTAATLSVNIKTHLRRTLVQHWQGIFLDWQSSGAWIPTEWIKEIQSVNGKKDPDHQRTFWCGSVAVCSI